MPKSFSNLTFTESAHIGLDDDTPEVPLKIRRDDNVSLDASSSAVKIDYNLSGTTAQTGNRLYEALLIDADSTATGGDATNEVRFSGIRAMVEDSGDANDLYGGYFDARNDKTIANDVVNNVFGVYSQAYGRHTAGQVKNIVGGYFTAYTDNDDSGIDVTTLAGVRAFALQTGDSGKTVDNAYGVYGKVDLAASTNNGTFTNADGVLGEIEIDDADSTITSARAVKGVIDSNAGTITNAYQFLGQTTTAGTITNSYGIYSSGASKHYLSGDVGINTTSPGGNLHVVGESGSSGQIYLSDVDNGSGTGDSLLINKSGTNAFVYNRDGGQMSFGTNDASNNIVIANTGAVTFSSSVTATSFSGDGSNITNVSATDSTKVAKAGDTMTGNLTISKTSPAITFNNTAGGGLDPTLRSVGTDFKIDTTSITALSLALDTGSATFAGSIQPGGNILLTGSNHITHAATGGIFDLNAESSRVRLTTNHPEIVFQIDADHTEPDTELFQINISTASSPPLKLTTTGLEINPINNATSDTNKFLVSDGNVIKYRTGTEVLSDIGAGTVTVASGAAGNVAFFTGSREITSTNKLIFDSTNTRLSVNGGTSPTNTLQIGGNGIKVTAGGIDLTGDLDLEGGAGDILMGNGSKFQCDGDPGTDGQFLKSTGSGVKWHDLPTTTQTILFSNFSDDSSSMSAFRIPFNSLSETTSNQYYNHFDCPSSGTIKRIRLNNTSGTPSTGFTVIIDIWRNAIGTPTQSSGSITVASGGVVEYDPDLSFSKGDEIQIAYRKSAGGKYLRGVSASIILEFTKI